MKRAMFVTNSLTGGGAERSMNIVVNELSKRGWPISLVPINSSEQDIVIPVCEVFQLRRNWRGSFINSLVAFVRFVRVVRKWNPDVVVLNCDLPELFGALILGKREFIIVEHSNLSWSTRKRIGKGVRKILTLKNAKWVAVSPHIKIWPTEVFAETIIQNPFLPSTSDTDRASKTQDILRLISIGRLSSEKCPHRILEIAFAVGMPVEIIGDGYLRASLEKQALELDIDVNFRGHVKDPWSYFKPGDVLISTSKSEGDGLVVIEGLEREFPMLLSDISDFRRFGLTEVNYCDANDDYVNRIREFVTNRDALIVSNEIVRSILSTRSLEVIIDAWESVLIR
jgi:glycosyltransferase involved in cell wall biosynthesis